MEIGQFTEFEVQLDEPSIAWIQFNTPRMP